MSTFINGSYRRGEVEERRWDDIPMGKDFLVTDRLRNWSRHKKRKIVLETRSFFFYFPLAFIRLDVILDNKWHER